MAKSKSTLRVVKTHKMSMDFRAGFKYAVVGPNLFFGFKTKKKAAKWLVARNKQLKKANEREMPIQGKTPPITPRLRKRL